MSKTILFKHFCFESAINPHHLPPNQNSDHFSNRKTSDTTSWHYRVWGTENGKCKAAKVAFTFIGWRNSHRRGCRHPHRQRRPLQGSAGEPRILWNDNSVGRTGRCSSATADFNFYSISGAEYENNFNRKDRQTAEILWTYNHCVIVHQPVCRIRSIVDIDRIFGIYCTENIASIKLYFNVHNILGIKSVPKNCI